MRVRDGLHLAGQAPVAAGHGHHRRRRRRRGHCVSAVCAAVRMCVRAGKVCGGQDDYSPPVLRHYLNPVARAHPFVS